MNANGGEWTLIDSEGGIDLTKRTSKMEGEGISSAIDADFTLNTGKNIGCECLFSHGLFLCIVNICGMILYAEDLLFKKECYQLVGVAMKVHTALGKGFKEVVYKDALEVEFRSNNIPYEREKPFNIKYGQGFLRHRFDADFVVYNSIILEIKAAYNLHFDHFTQTLNYLKASQIQLGILINFGEDRLNFKRIVCTY